MSNATKVSYKEVSEVPDGLRWDVPPQNGGQIVEVAYAHARSAKEPACHGSAWQRVTDQSFPTGHAERVKYYRKQR